MKTKGLFVTGSKKHLKICIMTAILLCGVFLLHAAASKSFSHEPKMTADTIRNKSKDAFTALVDSFFCKESGEPIYPDYYCGSWLDEDGKTLVIGLTDLSEATIAEYNNKTGSGSNPVRYVQMDYSRKELRDHLVSAAALINERLDVTVTGMGLLDKENRGFIGVLTEEEKAAVLASGLLNELPIVIHIISPTKLLSTDVKGGDHLYNNKCWV